MITLDDWQTVIQHDYLRSFIQEGGSAVKFVVTHHPSQCVADAMSSLAASDGYCYANLSASAVRLDRIDKLFHEVARQLDWNELANNVRSRCLSELGFSTQSSNNIYATYDSLAEEQGVAASLVRRDVQVWLTENVFRDNQLTQDFRKAMLWYCEDSLRSAVRPADRAANIRAWLTGDLRLLSAVRPLQIYQKIARHNARDMLASLGHWIRIAGKPGLVITADIRAAVNGAMPAESEVKKYSRAALLDLYEVLRQCIDSTDELQSILIVVISGHEFLEDDRRNVENYRALYLRMVEEVRDRSRDNPLATLVRVEK